MLCFKFLKIARLKNIYYVKEGWREISSLYPTCPKSSVVKSSIAATLNLWNASKEREPRPQINSVFKSSVLKTRFENDIDPTARSSLYIENLVILNSFQVYRRLLRPNTFVVISDMSLKPRPLL